MATINTATYFGLKGLGAILPGYSADMLIIDDLEELKISTVYHAGSIAAHDGKLVIPSRAGSSLRTGSSVHVAWEKIKDLSIQAEGNSVNIIQVVPGQIITRKVIEQAPIVDGRVVADTSRDILKIAVIERHRGTGNFSIGLIKGFGLKRGAIASTVAHDAHNIIVVGANDQDMLAAAHEADRMGGGMAVLDNGQVIGRLPLPIAGLMSDKPIAMVREGLDGLVAAAKEMGCTLDNPFATLSFMALTPIPELKLTDQGLFDSVNFKFISLFPAS
jgi:adenine deaminase